MGHIIATPWLVFVDGMTEYIHHWHLLPHRRHDVCKYYMDMTKYITGLTGAIVDITGH